MKKLILFIALLTIAGCGTAEQNVNGNSGGDTSQEVTNPSIDLADFETNVKVNKTNGKAIFTLSFTNKGEEPAELTFSSGQTFEVVVKDTTGKEVYRYSIDKSFIQALQTVTVEPGDTLTYEDQWDYTIAGERVPAGEYKVVGTIIPMEINGHQIEDEPFKGEATFTIEAGAENSEAEENTAFRNIKVTGSNGEYTITGEARVFEAVFMYAVEDGHFQLIPETPFQVKEGAPSWSAFEINLSIPEDKLPTNGTVTAHIYERSAKDGSIVNSYFVTLEQFK